MHSVARLLETSDDIALALRELEVDLEARYPGLDMIQLSMRGENGLLVRGLKVAPEARGQGVGSAVLKDIQRFARERGMPIVLEPEAEPRRKEALDRFYRRAGFRPNRGRKIDFTLSGMARTMVWRP